MKQRLEIMDGQLAALKRLLKNYPALDDLNAMPGTVYHDNLPPSVFIHARKRARVAELFGADGWTRHHNEGSRFIQARKLVDGVEVTMDSFELIGNCYDSSVSIVPDVAPDLLTREAGIAITESMR